MRVLNVLLVARGCFDCLLCVLLLVIGLFCNAFVGLCLIAGLLYCVCL